VQAWNPGVRQVTGFDADATVGRACDLFFPSREGLRLRMEERLEEADLSGWSLEEGWLQRAGGEPFWGSSLIAPLHAPDTQPGEERAYSMILRDISDRREANEALRRSVFCDHLTGLANRRAFFETAEVELQRCAQLGRPVSLLMFDADHFKAVNDRFGHAAGDAVLRHLAAGMCASFRADDLIARFGGEEFVVLMPRTTAAEAQAVAQRFCKGLSANPVTVDGVPIRCTVSGGVASMDGPPANLDTLLRNADAAMYVAKARGRDRVEQWHEDSATSAPSLGTGT
jgi:diguanylate cyclase (GGDEF)-like protein/PAS domain S-box-containing protein